MATHPRTWRPPPRSAAPVFHRVPRSSRPLHRSAGDAARGPHRPRGRGHPAGRAQPALPGGLARPVGIGPHRPQYPHPPSKPSWTCSPPPASRQPPVMDSRGSLQRKSVKGHPKAASRCSGRCIRWYPRLELLRGPDGTRRFEALGGHPTRAQAEAALADALARRSHGLALDPAKLTLNQYLDRWLVHVRTSLRARTVARYAALLRDHVRPSLGARPLKQLTPLEVQAVYDRLAIGGRRDGQPGGLAPSTSWPCTAACTARWPRRSPGGCSQPTSPPMPPHRQCPPPRW